MIPCACRKNPATLEKQGKSLCSDCAKNYRGQEYPLRDGGETICTDREKALLKYNMNFSKLRALFFR